MVRYIFLVFVALAATVLAGCDVNSKTDYVNNARQLTWATKGCTVAVPILAAKGKFGTITAMDASVYIGYNCSLSWYRYLKDPNQTPATDYASCATSCVIDMITLQSEANDMPKAEPKPLAVKTATDADVEAAKLGLDTAVARFDFVAGMVLKPKDAK